METSPPFGALLPFSSFSHNLTHLFPHASEGLALNLKLALHPNCVRLLKCAVNNTRVGVGVRGLSHMRRTRRFSAEELAFKLLIVALMLNDEGVGLA